MTSGLFNQIARNTGFSKLLGRDASQFILLDRDTDGRVGRPVYILEHLSSKFNGIPKDKLDLALHRLKQLRATAGDISAHSNLRNAKEHRSLVGTAMVSYKIFQNTGSAEHQPGVYITEITFAEYERGDPGLYKVTNQREEWEVDKRVDQITTVFAAINGPCRDLSQAATKIMPEMLGKAYSNKKWSGDLKSDGFTLFYNPPCLYEGMKLWQTPKQKCTNHAYTATALAKALLEASGRRQVVQWAVHGDGAHVLLGALKKLQGKDLSNHTVMFLSPTKEVSAILPLMREAKMGLHDDVMKIQDSDWRSKQSQMWHFHSLKKQLSQMPGFEDQAHLQSTQRFKDLRTWTGMVAGAATSGFGLAAFSPAIPTVGAIAGAALGAFAMWEKAQSIRNIAANSINNPGLNPHMQPFKTNDQMNLHARKHSGNALKTFADVIKGKLGL